jgi:hypothetical protein
MIMAHCIQFVGIDGLPQRSHSVILGVGGECRPVAAPVFKTGEGALGVSWRVRLPLSSAINLLEVNLSLVGLACS